MKWMLNTGKKSWVARIFLAAGRFVSQNPFAVSDRDDFPSRVAQGISSLSTPNLGREAYLRIAGQYAMRRRQRSGSRIGTSSEEKRSMRGIR